jgi:hypothetical protein
MCCKLIVLLTLLKYIREIRKVRKTQDQNPEFGLKPGEIQKKPAQKYISLQGETHKCTNFVPD